MVSHEKTPYQAPGRERTMEVFPIILGVVTTSFLISGLKQVERPHFSQREAQSFVSSFFLVLPRKTIIEKTTHHRQRQRIAHRCRSKRLIPSSLGSMDGGPPQGWLFRGPMTGPKARFRGHVSPWLATKLAAGLHIGYPLPLVM